jgi:Ca-activated chloride channel homolog
VKTLARICFALVLASFAFSTPPARAQSAGGDALLILDGSGSMWGPIDGQTKITMARQAVATILGRLPAGQRIGLMAYGHRRKSDCGDIELMIAPGSVDPARFNAAVGAITPRGKTPLSESLRQAARALAGQRKASVILVSDGIETCGADPCAVAAELKKAGVGFTAHVIGFDVADPVARRQLQCIARNTGGVYLDAGNAGALEAALGNAVAATAGKPVASAAPAREPAEDPLKGRNLRGQARLAAGLDPITDPAVIWALHQPGADDVPGEFEQNQDGARLAMAAPAGRHVLVVTYGQTTRRIPVTVATGRTTEVDVVLDAAFVVSEGTIAGSGAKAEQIAWDLTGSGGYAATSYDPVPRFIVPAGDYQLKLSKGAAAVTKDFSVVAGDSINVALTLAAGRLIVTGRYAAAGPAARDELAVDIRRLPGTDGAPGEAVSSGYGPEASFDLPGGGYEIVASVGAAQVIERVEVEPGATRRVAITLGAGMTRITTAGSNAIEVFAAEAGGGRRSMGVGYDGRFDVTLPAGSYVAVASFGDRSVERVFTVTAGSRGVVDLRP